MQTGTRRMMVENKTYTRYARSPLDSSSFTTKHVLSYVWHVVPVGSATLLPGNLLLAN